MWLSPKIFSVLEVAKERVDSLREELAAVRAERDALTNRLTSLQVTFDWMRVNWNQTQAENKALMSRVYGIQVPVPELAPKPGENQFNLQNLFNDTRELDNSWDN